MKNSVPSIKQINERILKDWEKKSIKEEKLEIVKDGILFKGDIIYKDYECWERYPGNEMELWDNAPLRYLFITKDMNDEGVEDLRKETGLKNYSGIYSKSVGGNFNPKYLGIVYALAHTNNFKMCPPLKSITDEELLRTFSEAPIARINAKKQNGGAQIEYSILDSYIIKYKILLSEQILNIDADIIVCCCYSSSVYSTIPSKNPFINFLNTNCGYNFKPISKLNWIYYDEEKNKIAINSFHLSYPSFTKADIDMMSIDYHDFLIKHSNFLNSHRV